MIMQVPSVSFLASSFARTALRLSMTILLKSFRRRCWERMKESHFLGRKIKTKTEEFIILIPRFKTIKKSEIVF